MQTITPNSSLAQVIQNPLGRDLLEKVLLNFGFKPEDFERSAIQSFAPSYPRIYKTPMPAH